MLEFHRERLEEEPASPLIWMRVVRDHLTAASLEWMGSLRMDAR
jgi:hypothetical protein